MYAAVFELTSHMWSQPQYYKFVGETPSKIYDQLCDDAPFFCIVRSQELNFEQTKQISNMIKNLEKENASIDDLLAFDIKIFRGTIKCIKAVEGEEEIANLTI